MTERLEKARVLIYSHDTFGLGHLRRCRAIAHSLVEQYKGLSVLILSGSPIIGSFDFRARVDFVRIPGVIKLYNGEYTSLALHIDLEQTLRMRESIIRHTAETFAPDLFLVDKEPLGLQGEVANTLAMLKRQGVPVVLGLRDVMDEPSQLRREWERKQVMPALKNIYDEIWVYGIAKMGDPLAGTGAPADVYAKTLFTGYLQRALPAEPIVRTPVNIREPFVFVTSGGGGDGFALIDWVLRAYESDQTLPHAALIVFGPFMPSAMQEEFMARVDPLERVEAITFDAHIENLMARAAGIVAMGGYNTFCEILSLNQRAILVPRSVPRREQLIRGARAAALGLVKLLDADRDRDTLTMIDALRALPAQPLPSEIAIPGLLDGLATVNRRVKVGIESGYVVTPSIAQSIA